MILKKEPPTWGEGMRGVAQGKKSQNAISLFHLLLFFN